MEALGIPLGHVGTPLTGIVAPWGAPPKAPVAAPACSPPPHFATPLTRFVAPYGAPPRAPVAGSAGSSTYASAYPHIPHTFCVHIGAPPKAPMTRSATPKTPVAARACSSISAHSSHVSWPHWELHRRPQWQRPHAVPPSFRHTLHTFRGPIGSSTEGPSGSARVQFHFHFSAPVSVRFRSRAISFFLVKAVLFLLSSCPHPLPPSLSVAIFPFLPPPFSSCVLRFRSSWHDTIVRGPLGPCQNDSTSSSASSSSSPSARNSS